MINAEVTINLSKLSATPQQISKALIEVADIYMERIYAESQTLVPVDTGALQESGKFTPAQLVGGVVEADITYGNEMVDYAVVVHEDLQTYHEPPTGAKYLENPAAEILPEFIAAIKRRLSEIL